MRPRTYDSKRIVPMQAVRESDRPISQIPRDAKLYSIDSASVLLNEQFDGGFGVTQIRRWIANETWQEGLHYVKAGKRCKIYLPAVQDWVTKK